MARNIYGILIYNDSTGLNTFTVSGGETKILDIDLYGVNNGQLLIEEVYSSTGSPTGLTATVKYGFGESDSTATGQGNGNSWQVNYVGPAPCKLGGTSAATFSDNADSISMATVTPSVGTTQTIRSYFSLNDIRIFIPRWIRLSFTNTDASHTATVKIYMDI